MSVLAKRKLLGEYRIGRTIGEGAFSKVKVATHKLTNEKVRAGHKRSDHIGCDQDHQEGGRQGKERRERKEG
jgi:hypothetical protein